MQHKVVEEQLHLAAIDVDSTKMLKEPLQHSALDIAPRAVCWKSLKGRGDVSQDQLGNRKRKV
jgi:hypothetical protein